MSTTSTNTTGKRATKAEVTALLSEIDTHLEKFPRGRSYFGHVAAENSNLIRRLESGKGCSEQTVKKVRKFMSQEREQAAKSRADCETSH